MGHLANRMRSLAAAGNPRAEELIEKADELDKMIDADAWDTEKVLCAWLQGAEVVVRCHGRAAALAVILAPLSDAHCGNRDPRSPASLQLLGRAAQRAAGVCLA